MERAEKLRLTQRLVAHVDADSTDYADDLLTVPFSAFMWQRSTQSGQLRQLTRPVVRPGPSRPARQSRRVD